MNGGADLGGMQGFGQVAEETDEPLFHGDWEARVMALVIAMGATGQWNIDQSRYSRESLPPADYLRWPYYRIWLEAAEKLMLDRELISPEDLARSKAVTPPKKVTRTLAAENVRKVLYAGGPVDRPTRSNPQFDEGELITTININPSGHTRLPRYARGKTGEISTILGHHVFPDANARGEGEQPTWLYQVRFTARELWGNEANPRDSVTLDLFEPYLRPSS